MDPIFIALTVLCSTQHNAITCPIQEVMSEDEFFTYLQIRDETATFAYLFEERLSRIICSHELAIDIYQLVEKTITDPEKFKFKDPTHLVYLQRKSIELGPHLKQIQLDPQTLRKNINTVYNTTFGFTPTPEVTNTPDHHWANISLDILYKNQILVGDPK